MLRMSKLEKHVKEWAEENSLKDVVEYGCVSGAVSHLVYYHDTHKFFDEYYEDIQEEVEEYEEMTGQKVCPEGDIKNWYSWFAFESVANKLHND
jgi:hypothetical protein